MSTPAPWKCSNCETVNFGDAGACRRCDTPRAATGSLGVQFAPQPPFSPAQPFAYAASVVTRYRAAYAASRGLEAFGTVAKIVGICAGFLIAGLGVLFAIMMEFTSREPVAATVAVVFAVGACMVGAAAFAVAYGFGVLVTLLGQLLKAQLDIAVNTSPFLDDLSKARAMGVAGDS